MGDDGREFEEAMRRLGVGSVGAVDPSDEALFEAELARMGMADEAPPEGEADEAPPEPAVRHQVAEDAALFEAALEDFGPPPDQAEAAPRSGARRPSLTTGSHQTLRRRLKRGEIRHELELDLHGMREEDARRAVTAFLRRGRSEGREVVRVICGRGNHSRDRAVLREAVPRWLRGELREHVADAVSAPAVLGGSGAWYVILRRA